MKTARWFVLSGAVFLLAACQTEGIRFPSAEVMPGESSLSVIATVHRPQGAGPFPALVLLHTCGSVNEAMTNRANFVKDLGYVALVVDTFGFRGVDGCPISFMIDSAMTRDAYGALDYLASLPYVKKHRIGVMGFSAGGHAIDRFVSREYQSPGGLNFRAAVNMYGVCQLMGDAVFEDEKIIIRTVMILGDQEESWRLFPCRDLIGKSPMITVHIFKGVYHAFDSRRNASMDSVGNIIQYSASATAKAEEITTAFFAKHLGK